MSFATPHSGLYACAFTKESLSKKEDYSCWHFNVFLPSLTFQNPFILETGSQDAIDYRVFIRPSSSSSSEIMMSITARDGASAVGKANSGDPSLELYFENEPTNEKFYLECKTPIQTAAPVSVPK